MLRMQPSSCILQEMQYLFMYFLSLSLSNRGPPQEEAPALTNSNVRHPHPPPTRTQGPSSLSLRYPHQPSPWFSPCPPRQLCRSTQHSSLPPSLNATHSLCLCAWARPLNATTLPQQQLPSLTALEVKFLTLYQLHERSSFKSFQGERNDGGAPSVKQVACQIHAWRYLTTLKRNGWTEK